MGQKQRVTFSVPQKPTLSIYKRRTYQLHSHPLLFDNTSSYTLKTLLFHLNSVLAVKGKAKRAKHYGPWWRVSCLHSFDALITQVLEEASPLSPSPWWGRAAFDPRAIRCQTWLLSFLLPASLHRRVLWLILSRARLRTVATGEAVMCRCKCVCVCNREGEKLPVCVTC